MINHFITKNETLYHELSWSHSSEIIKADDEPEKGAFSW